MLRGIVVLLVALALPHDGAAQTRSAYVTVQLRGFVNPIRLDTVASWSDVWQGPGETFGAVRRVLDSLQIPVAIADSARGLLHNPGFTARIRLAGKPMSRLMRCGVGMTGDYADSYRITIAYAVLIDPLPEGHSRVGIAMVSSAQNVQGTRTEPAMCGTTGTLEQTILKAAQLELLKPKAS